LNPPIIRVWTPGISGELYIDVAAMEPGDKARVYLYEDGPTGVGSVQTWPTLLDSGVHTLDGLTDGVTYGVYAWVEDEATGSALSWPSNLEKAVPSEGLTYSIQLKREIVETYTVYGVKAYRLQITVESTVNLPDNIFLYKKETPVGGVGDKKDSFVSVCIASDLEQFPPYEPQSGEPPFYRLDWIDVVEEELETIDQIWTDINSATLALEIQMRELDGIRRQERYAAHNGTSPEPSLSSVSLSYSSDSVIMSSSISTSSSSAASGSLSSSSAYSSLSSSSSSA
jgi:hypothetical protein